MAYLESTNDQQFDTRMHPVGDPNHAISKDTSIEESKKEHGYPSGVALYSVLIPVTIGYFLYFLDTCIVATASPAITVHFNALIDIGWYGGAYQLGNAAVRPLTGKIYSHFSTKAGDPYSPLEKGGNEMSITNSNPLS